jgi:hypothetical protein
LTFVSAVVANTHLLFPLTAAPCVLLLVRAPAQLRRLIVVAAAIMLGWFISPYALHWVDVYKLNFAPNAMFGPPPSIAEYQPGFSAAASFGVSSLYIAFVFVFLPWLVALRYNGIERVLHGLLWFAGLILFSLAVRALVVWWLVIIPSVAIAVETLPSPTLPLVRTAQRATIIAIFAVVALLGVENLRDPWMRAGSISSRALPSTNARAIEPIAEWLDCNVRRDMGGRLVTSFNYGGYVPWRLPYLSESVDGRTIFPDSVARAETYVSASRLSAPLPPWRSADLAIASVNTRIGAVLDTAAGWRRVAITSQLEGKATMIGLWVTDRWWTRAGRIPLPKGVVPLPHLPPGDRPACHVVATLGSELAIAM